MKRKLITLVAAGLCAAFPGLVTAATIHNALAETSMTVATVQSQGGFAQITTSFSNGLKVNQKKGNATANADFTIFSASLRSFVSGTTGVPFGKSNTSATRDRYLDVLNPTAYDMKIQVNWFYTSSWSGAIIPEPDSRDTVAAAAIASFSGPVFPPSFRFVGRYSETEPSGKKSGKGFFELSLNPGQKIRLTQTSQVTGSGQTVIPVPASLVLLASGLLGVFGLGMVRSKGRATL